MVNRPDHYCKGRQYEPLSVISDWDLNYRLGSALKYISRAGRKQDAIEDLKKAVFYLNREIEALEGARSSYNVPYQDVLQDAAYEAANGSEPLYEYGITIPQADVDDSHLPFWDSDEDYMWDPSLGPVDLTDEEIKAIMAKKDLNMFDEDEIIATVEKRGFILGIKKDGSTCELGSNGRCM
jgi:hypothetical protein